jgi:hypothetical protein
LEKDNHDNLFGRVLQFLLYHAHDIFSVTRIGYKNEDDVIFHASKPQFSKNSLLLLLMLSVSDDRFSLYLASASSVRPFQNFDWVRSHKNSVAR